jgi:DNA repair protein RadA/Sms
VVLCSFHSFVNKKAIGSAMAKAQSHYVCQSCGASSVRWQGQCPACNAWGTLLEETQEARPKAIAVKKGKGLELAALDDSLEDVARIPTGMGELDRVLGGGLVAGSVTLVGGDPGIGKSTLLLQMAGALDSMGIPCWYISGEESVRQIGLRAKRLGIQPKNGGQLRFSASGQMKDIAASLDSVEAPAVVIVDSIQTMMVEQLDAAPGTVSQVRAASHELIRIAKKRHMAVLMVGHVTKDGQIAGPRVLEHMVDSVLYFEGERGHNFRILRGVKNRFGGTDEIGVFEMAGDGLREVGNPSELFLSHREEELSGCAVFAGMEGSRPMLVEVQALVAPSFLATPRRAVVGWDSARLAMLLAVLEARCGIRLSDKEVYLNVTGGFRIQEPAADLAVAAALLSALSDQPIPKDTAIFGEIGLSGEVRAVAHMERRLKEAGKLGFRSVWTPPLHGGRHGGGDHRVIDDVHALAAGFDLVKRSSFTDA